jgi:DNA (cytosine-5)-methyltransferase 1
MAKSVFSFFAGAGLLDLGFENEHYNVVFVNEFEQSFLDAYIYARQQRQIQPHQPRYGFHCGDINLYLQEEERDNLIRLMNRERAYNNIVGFIGGPPCPDFSVAGKNKGKDGDNGALALSYIKLIIECQPDFFVFENVKGLVKTEKHRKFFNYLKKKLQKSGYATSNKVLNALCYGVPQDRDRVIFVGFNKIVFSRVGNIMSANGRLLFPWANNVVFNDLNVIKSQHWPEHQPFLPGYNRYCPRNLPHQYRVLAVETWFRKNNVTTHPNANDIFRVKNGRNKITTIDEGDVSRKSFKRLHRWRYSPTAAYGNNEVHLHPYYPRRISVAEAMAIQSLPAWFTLPHNMSLTHKFKVIGNGVPYLMSRAIAKTVFDVIDTIK